MLLVTSHSPPSRANSPLVVTSSIIAPKPSGVHRTTGGWYPFGYRSVWDAVLRGSSPRHPQPSPRLAMPAMYPRRPGRRSTPRCMWTSVRRGRKENASRVARWSLPGGASTVGATANGSAQRGVEQGPQRHRRRGRSPAPATSRWRSRSRRARRADAPPAPGSAARSTGTRSTGCDRRRWRRGRARSTAARSAAVIGSAESGPGSASGVELVAASTVVVPASSKPSRR